MSREHLQRRAQQYADQRKLVIGKQLGSGVHDWEADKREQFEARWPEVQAILRALQVHGIYMLDVNPGNISFE